MAGNLLRLDGSEFTVVMHNGSPTFAVGTLQPMLVLFYSNTCPACVQFKESMNIIAADAVQHAQAAAYEVLSASCNAVHMSRMSATKLQKVPELMLFDKGLVRAVFPEGLEGTPAAIRNFISTQRNNTSSAKDDPPTAPTARERGRRKSYCVIDCE